MRSVMTLLLAAVALPAFGQSLTAEQMVTATGIGKLIARADHCGYKLDDAALGAYYEKQGLATPEALAWVSLQANAEAQNLPKLASGECSVSKATARSMGVLIP